MKITNNGLNAVPPSKPEAAGAVDKAAQKAETSPVEKHDRAELSEQARLMMKMKTRLDELNATESDRLEELRKQVQSGNYEVPVDQLAQILANRLKNL